MPQVTHTTETTGNRPQPPAVPTMSASASYRLAFDVEQQFITEITGGVRIDLKYPDSATPIQSYGSQAALPGNSVLLSGSDWVVVNEQGVVSFDSRITLSFTGDPDPTGAVASALVTARLRGQADLARLVKSPQSASSTFPGASADVLFSRLKAGLGERAYLPVTLAVSFDVPTKGFEAKQDVILAKCQHLGKDLFIGLGFAQLDPNSQVKRIVLDLFKGSDITHPPVAGFNGAS